MTFVINAGGKGLRMRPYTNILPKPLLTVDEKTILEHIIQRFVKFGCRDFHIIVNYKKNIIKSFFSDLDKDYRINFYDEDLCLGTGGWLRLLKGYVNETFFFINCDTFLFSNYDSILKFHKENKNHITMICSYKHINIPYGVVSMGWKR